ncbi:MAG: hypothetical protein QOE85_1956, partial [Actinomycetota bacterium]|nr:hypothetical protein [Actinomycetota bacterium]
MVGLFPDYAGYQKKTDRVKNPRVCPRVMRVPPYVRGLTHHPGADA